ncbi:MAG: DUF885 domain-containing protein [Bryobacteraceae bacterium]
MRSLGIVFLLFAMSNLARAQVAPSATLEARRQALNDALDQQWEYNLRTSPEFASMLGDKRYNDQVSDASIEGVKRDLEETRRFLKMFQAIDTTGFPEQEVLNKRLMVRNLEETLEGERFKNWEMPVNQMNGIQIDLPQLPVLLTFKTVKDYRDYLSRIHKWPTSFDQTIATMRAGMADNLMPPKFLLEKVADQAKRVADSPINDSPFATPLQHFPDSISKADQAAIRKDIDGAIQNELVPAYRRFQAFVRDEYTPRGRTEVGIWSLPDGAARYAYAVKTSTTSTMTPAEIHELGVAQVAEIEVAEKAIASKLGFDSIKALRLSVNSNPKLHFHSAEEMLDLYRGYIDQMYTKLPTLFTHLPKARVNVAAIEDYRAKESSTGYVFGAADGSRPGRVEVNTYGWEKQITPGTESTAYHEGVPGHHLQISIAQELTGLPQFRRQGNYGAFAEGWALYSERLGKEVGFYQDPYSDYGRLEDEMLRAIRLVVDTGLHDKHWSREDVVNYFHEHSNQPESLVQSETDRYIVWPGQALSYKVGQLTILRLREKAKKSLGPKFDIRLFHDEVLGAGALPLDVLTERIDQWIAQQI